MKKLTFSIFTVLILALTACSSGTSNTQQVNSGQSTDTSSIDLPLASKLVIGSFKLEGTDNVITAEQAAELLPLWQVYQQLSTSDTAAQEEITALAEQIQETMTTDQMAAINAMNLTPQDIFTVMQDQGVQFGGTQGNQGNSSQNSNGESRSGGFQGGGPGGGGFPSGAPPEGGQGQGLNPDQIATMQARRAENGGVGFRLNGTPAPLIEALVKLLQKKAGS
jgi:uncharacterized membrane protein YgcG